jgi:EAL domain-containing protein (putative c-di-GMP-specific phosphodiesterase class I)
MASIVRRIVELAHDHGACAIAQGYLFGKPQAIRKFARSRPQLASSSSKKI